MRRKSLAACEAANVLKMMTLGARTSSMYRFPSRSTAPRNSSCSFDGEMSVLHLAASAVAGLLDAG
jgi:hypothetical protein